MTAPILTLTGNLLWERTLEYTEWEIGHAQRPVSESLQVGGKGINVGRMLKRLNVPSLALCFTGGAPGRECEEWLRARGLAFLAFASSTATRVGTVVRGGGKKETTFFGMNAPPSRDAIEACAKFLEAQPDGMWLAVGGSIPGWTDASFDALRAALERWMQRGKLVVDTYGPPLSWFAERPLELAKINADEFRALHGSKNDAGEVLKNDGGRWPAKQWIITDGPQTVWTRDDRGHVVQLSPPPVKEVSATGSGDVLLACVLRELQRGQPLVEAVKFALPYAAANAAHPGVAEFPLP